MMNKVIHIVGPTGIGKTALAFDLATKFGGELVNADSIQIYKGLDIISGKDIPESSKSVRLPHLSSNGINTGYYTSFSIPIFLLDVVDTNFPFSVSHYQKLGEKVLDFINEKDKLPIVVGGTGLYIKSLIEGFTTNHVKPNLLLRKSLEKLTIEEIQKKVKKEKLILMNKSDRNNKRRLIRAIEITESGKLNSNDTKNAKYKSLVLGLFCDREVLKKRIDKRVDTRIKNGALREAELLFKNYINLADQVKNANGYKQLFQYLNEEISFKEATYRWKISEYHHAKNQMTWFKKYNNVVWFDVRKNTYKKNIEQKIIEFLS